MPTNVEIKAKVTDLEGFQKRVKAISETHEELILQEDTFYHTPKGRLKLRILAGDRGQLIYYERGNQTGPKQSDYWLFETAEPENLKQVLDEGLGIRGAVRKKRRLYRVGNTRIHLDEVAGLGTFMELEVVLTPGQSLEDGQKVAAGLMEKLKIDEKDLIVGAYIDLMENRKRISGR
jgi:predicted adenylyl cyclase CyaB